jgi:hypothetical protein
MGVIWKTVLVALVCLAAADVAGAIAVTIFDILPLKFASAAVAYAIWLVLGGFCGLFAYNIAGEWASPKAEAGAPDWSARPSAAGIGTGVMITALVIVAGLAALFYAIIWSHGGVASDDDYVPDSLPHSIVFFLAVTAALIGARFFLMPTPDKDALSQ